MSSSSKDKTPINSACECAEWQRRACFGEPKYKHEDKKYCVIHLPSKDKSEDFKRALEAKLKDGKYDFCGAWFPDEVNFAKGGIISAFFDFSETTFSAKADFTNTKFNDYVSFTSASFKEMADFGRAQFNSEISFVNTHFQKWAFFGDAQFNAQANFRNAVFSDMAYFQSVQLIGQVDFSNAGFKKNADFSSAIIKNYVQFAGGLQSSGFNSESFLSLQFARLENADYLSFHTLRLHPHWFVNVDARKINFINVDWHKSLSKEIRRLEGQGIFPSHRLLSIALRNLAVNAEENHRYEEASKFRYMAMDTLQREKWQRFAVWRLSWWYWIASGYGERVFQAFFVLLVVWALFAFLFTKVGFARFEPKLTPESDLSSVRRDEVGAPLAWPHALTYSLSVMILQKPEPQPITTWAHILVIAETILGPLQAALLALAIRRKFMR